ncbi:MAG: hypothetical protein HY985_17525 [Magnetospirillum sp.]|nr:hypothetical protein [Magnetospirillum sp.]
MGTTGNRDFLLRFAALAVMASATPAAAQGADAQPVAPGGDVAQEAPKPIRIQGDTNMTVIYGPPPNRGNRADLDLGKIRNKPPAPPKKDDAAGK